MKKPSSYKKIPFSPGLKVHQEAAKVSLTTKIKLMIIKPNKQVYGVIIKNEDYNHPLIQLLAARNNLNIPKIRRRGQKTNSKQHITYLKSQEFQEYITDIQKLYDIQNKRIVWKLHKEFMPDNNAIVNKALELPCEEPATTTSNDSAQLVLDHINKYNSQLYKPN